MINDLNNDHTDAYLTSIYNYVYKGYKQAAAQYPIYNFYVEELEKTDSIRAKYWKDINLELFFPKKPNNTNKVNVSKTKTKVLENVEVNFIDSISTAIVQVKSFRYEHIEEDTDTLKYFFNKTHNYKNLIIDIQGND